MGFANLTVEPIEPGLLGEPFVSPLNKPSIKPIKLWKKLGKLLSFKARASPSFGLIYNKPNFYARAFKPQL